jgi:DNA-binding transcriptional regulator YhcF (GntR family)
MYIKLYHAIINSNAWRVSSSNARAIYIGLLAKSSNGSEPVVYSVREAGKFANVSKNTAALTLKELEKIGLIECIEDSGFSSKKEPRKWAIVEGFFD